MGKWVLPDRMRQVALDLPEPDDLTNREYWLRTEILEWADDLEKALGIIVALEHHWISPMEYYEATEDIHERLRRIGVLATRKNRGSTLAKDLLRDLNKIAVLAGEIDDE